MSTKYLRNFKMKCFMWHL